MQVLVYFDAMEQRNHRSIARGLLAVFLGAVGLSGCGLPPTLSAIQDNIFSPSSGTGCTRTDVTAVGCHSMDLPEDGSRGGLVLVDGISYSELVNVMAEGDPTSPDPSSMSCPGCPASMPMDEIRVIPGDAENSFLVKKLENRMDFGEGEPMPNVPGPGLTDAEIRAIREWIDRGAEDN